MGPVLEKISKRFQLQDTVDPWCLLITWRSFVLSSRLDMTYNLELWLPSKQVRHIQRVFHSDLLFYDFVLGTLCFRVWSSEGYLIHQDAVFFTGGSPSETEQLGQRTDDPYPSFNSFSTDSMYRFFTCYARMCSRCLLFTNTAICRHVLLEYYEGKPLKTVQYFFVSCLV